MLFSVFGFLEFFVVAWVIVSIKSIWQLFVSEQEFASDKNKEYRF